MYQVIILYNENSHSYYQSYTMSADASLGNITTDELPPYQDILKAQSCWWDFDTETWVYDDEMYQQLVAEDKQRKAEEEQRRLESEAQLTNGEITEAIMEIAQNQSDLFEAVAELGNMLATLMN